MTEDDSGPAAPTALAHHLDTAGITSAALAEHLGVSRGTIANYRAGGGVQDPTTRAKIAALIFDDLSPRDGIARLWPDYRYSPTVTHDGWERFTDVDTETWNTLIGGCVEHFDVIVGSGVRWFETHQNLGRQFTVRAELGTPVTTRVLTADPRGSAVLDRDADESAHTTLEPGTLPGRVKNGLNAAYGMLGALDDSAIHLLDPGHWPEYAMFRFDETIITYPYLPGTRGLDSPTERYTQDATPEQFHTYTRAFDILWAARVEAVDAYTNGG